MLSVIFSPSFVRLILNCRCLNRDRAIYVSCTISRPHLALLIDHQFYVGRGRGRFQSRPLHRRKRTAYFSLGRYEGRCVFLPVLTHVRYVDTVPALVLSQKVTFPAQPSSLPYSSTHHKCSQDMCPLYVFQILFVSLLMKVSRTGLWTQVILLYATKYPKRFRNPGFFPQDLPWTAHG